MNVQVRLDSNNVGFIKYGIGAGKNDAVIAQDAARTEPLVFGTVMARNPATLKYTPLVKVSGLKTSGQLVCGTNGALLAAWQAVTDGEVRITVDGVILDLIGLDFSSISALADVATVIIAAGQSVFNVTYASNFYTFLSNSSGFGSKIDFLLPVPSGTGTDISGTGFLNGLTGGTAVVTDGVGGEERPVGIYTGSNITAAAIVAGDITDAVILVGNAYVDTQQVVLENGLTLNHVIPDLQLTIGEALSIFGIYIEDTIDISSYEN